MSIIVVGGGVAGVRAALGARAEAPKATVTLFCDEAISPYDRTSLSKQVLLGECAPEDMPIIPAEDYVTERITVLRGVCVEEVNHTARLLTASDGTTHSYDSLILATGADIRRLPFDNGNIQHLHYLRTREDAMKVRARLGESQRLVVIGAGLIGLEVAAAAQAMNIEVDVLEASHSILGRCCDALTATTVERYHLDHGVRIHTNCRVASLANTQNAPVLVRLDDGTCLEADLVVAGIGVVPNTALAERAGVAIDNGIIVDEFGRTSLSGVYAAGDVAQIPLPFFSSPVRLETWRHAQDHGDVIGRNAAGAKQAYQAPPSFWSDQYGHRIQGAGLISEEATNRITRTYEDGSHVSFHMTNHGVLRTAIGIDRPQDINCARRLIAAGVPIVPAELADPQIAISKIVKQTKPKKVT
ncbi:NAD(P)/FAD-dependent oxidoreductase [Chromohalobacter israelensis]|uniref:NAD(P)/FAD-dependent oxidoreductase n=1 Tax=Chromohalobacter israelensis TaxID=141390 RepID=UPI001CC70381|nr:FAD-dependent oxidoreductase [Chromohalobacter salexigens]MBZ5876243.1 FAD-dependent oxidoreductase [Chromohalobacter salexigens]